MIRTLRQQRRLKAGAIAQFALFGLLQLCLVLPPISQSMSTQSLSHVCQGDHELCGCAPERVAAGTCCCALKAMPPCCRAKAEKAAKTDGPQLRNAPCGGSEPVAVSMVDDFLLAENESPEPLLHPFTFHPDPPDRIFSRFDAPPVPPPQHLQTV